MSHREGVEPLGLLTELQLLVGSWLAEDGMSHGRRAIFTGYPLSASCSPPRPGVTILFSSDI